MSHLSISGVRRASPLPAVIHRKLARCQRKNGRICLKSQRSSFGTKTDCGLRSCEKVDNSPTWKTRVRKRDRVRPENVVNVRFSIKSCAFPQQSANFSAYLISRFVRKLDKKRESLAAHRNLLTIVTICPTTSASRWFRNSSRASTRSG